MSTEGNKAIVRRLVQAINDKNLAAIDQVCAPELARGLKGDGLTFIYGTFGESHRAEITDMVAEGDRVWARLGTRGDHVGEWLGIPPTHRKWTNTGVYFVRLENGKVVEVDSLFDNLNLLQQLGARITPS